MTEKQRRALEKVLKAWRVDGPAPFYHRFAMKRLKDQWPTLYVALSELEEAYRE